MRSGADVDPQVQSVQEGAVSPVGVDEDGAGVADLSAVAVDVIPVSAIATVAVPASKRRTDLALDDVMGLPRSSEESVSRQAMCQAPSLSRKCSMRPDRRALAGTALAGLVPTTEGAGVSPVLAVLRHLRGGKAGCSLFSLI